MQISLMMFSVCILLISSLVLLTLQYRYSENSTANVQVFYNAPLPFEKANIPKIIPPDDSRKIYYNHKLSSFVKIFLDDYVVKHKFLRDTCNKNRSLAQETKLLVYRGNPRYGMGDRIRGALNAFLLASITDRLLLLDMEEPVPLRTALTEPIGYNFTFDESIFSVNLSRTNEIDVKDDLLFSSILDYNTDVRVVLQRTMKGIDITRLIPLIKSIPKKFNILTSAGLELFSPLDHHIAPLIMRSMFRTSSDLRARIEREYPFKGQKFFGIHARLGHGIGEFIQRFDPSVHGLSLYHLGICIGRAGAVQAKEQGLSNIFISTDTKRINQVIKSGIKEIIPSAEVIFAKGDPIHVGDLLRKSLHKSELINHFLKVFVDLGHLASAENLVSFQSGFADLASWIGFWQTRFVIEKEECKVLKISKE